MPLLDRNIISQIAANEKIDPIAEAVLKGECILFLGSGVHHGPPDGSAFDYPAVDRPPVGTALSKELAAECDFARIFPHESDSNWQRVALCYEITHSREALVKRIAKAVHINRKPSRALQALAELPFPIIITTNFDQLFETALHDADKQPVVDIYDKSTGKHDDWPRQPTVKEPVLLKIHGDIQSPASIVITDEDYIDFVLRMTSTSTNSHPVPFDAQFYLKRYMTLFVGYSLLDYNLRLLFKTLRWNVDEAVRMPFYSVDPFPDPLIYDVWYSRTRHVTFVAQDGWKFIPELYQKVLGKPM
jgi:SIR2-like domain